MRIRGGKRGIDLAFCGLLEETLRNDENFKIKFSIIKELRNLV